MERWYKGSMFKSGVKAKTSITLSLPTLVKIDKLIGQGASRSAFIEKVLNNHLRNEERRALQLRDMERINAAADRLNAEMAEVLEDQEAFYFDLVDDKNRSQESEASSVTEEAESPAT